MTPHLLLLYLLNTAAGLAAILGVLLAAWLLRALVVGLWLNAGGAPGPAGSADADGRIGGWRAEDWPRVISPEEAEAGRRRKA